MKKHTVSSLLRLLPWLAVIVAALLLSRRNYPAMVLCTMGIYVIAVSGLDILFGYSGQISFGNAAFYLIGAYTSALLSKELDIPPFVSMLCGAALAMLVGAIVAFPACKLVHHFLSFLTIAFGNIMYNLVANLKFTGRTIGITGIPKMSFFGYVLDTKTKYFVFVLAVAAIMLLLKYRIINSRVGRAFIAIRDNTHAANGCGVNIRKYKVLAFAISAFYAGIAGGVYAHLLNFISPDAFRTSTSVLFMTMLLFGGMGSFVGPVIGSVVLTLVQNWLQVFSIYQMLVYALFLLLVLYFMPNGVKGLFDRGAALIKRIRSKTGGAEKC